MKLVFIEKPSPDVDCESFLAQGPGLIDFQGDKLDLDVNLKSKKFVIEKKLFKIKTHSKLALFISLFMHLCVYMFFIHLDSLLELKFRNNPEEQPVEVSLGLLVNEKTVIELKPGQSFAEAEKSARTLPQLPKKLTLDIPDLPPDAIPEPTVVPTPNAPTPTVLPSVNAQKEEDKQVISMQEFLKRAEKERRKVGKNDVEGINKSVTKLPNPGSPFKDIPKNPLGNIEKGSVAKNSIPLGALEGTANGSAENSYKIAVLAHVKLYWKVSDLVQFQPGIEFIALFDVNIEGKIIGKIDIIKKSGDAKFDEMALSALTEANPFPDLPSELAPKQRIKMRFTPADVK